MYCDIRFIVYNEGKAVQTGFISRPKFKATTLTEINFKESTETRKSAFNKENSVLKKYPC